MPFRVGPSPAQPGIGFQLDLLALGQFDDGDFVGDGPNVRVLRFELGGVDNLGWVRGFDIEGE